MVGKIRIAHLAGPNATIQNTPPLVTSNKARVKRQLPERCGPDGTPLRYDVLRPQRLAAPAKVRINFMGGLNRDQLNDVYAKSHVMILPSQ